MRTTASRALRTLVGGDRRPDCAGRCRAVPPARLAIAVNTKEMPAAVPPSVQQHSAGFSFSKVEGDRTEFTVRA